MDQKEIPFEIQEYINKRFQENDLIIEARLKDLESIMRQKMESLSFGFEAEFQRRQIYLQVHLERECEKRKRLFPKWWK